MVPQKIHNTLFFEAFSVRFLDSLESRLHRWRAPARLNLVVIYAHSPSLSHSPNSEESPISLPALIGWFIYAISIFLWNSKGFTVCMTLAISSKKCVSPVKLSLYSINWVAVGCVWAGYCFQIYFFFVPGLRWLKGEVFVLATTGIQVRFSPRHGCVCITCFNFFFLSLINQRKMIPYRSFTQVGFWCSHSRWGWRLATMAVG